MRPYLSGKTLSGNFRNRKPKLGQSCLQNWKNWNQELVSAHLPKKGFLGYKAEDVERYIAVTQKALAIKEPAQLHTNTKELMHLIQELRNKQSQEK